MAWSSSWLVSMTQVEITAVWLCAATLSVDRRNLAGGRPAESRLVVARRVDRDPVLLPSCRSGGAAATDLPLARDMPKGRCCTAPNFAVIEVVQAAHDEIKPLSRPGQASVQETLCSKWFKDPVILVGCMAVPSAPFGGTASLKPDEVRKCAHPWSTLPSPFGGGTH